MSPFKVSAPPAGLPTFLPLQLVFSAPLQSDLVATGAGPSQLPTYSRALAAHYRTPTGLIVLADSGAPRFEQISGENYMLFEPETTNLLWHSNDFSKQSPVWPTTQEWTPYQSTMQNDVG